MLQMPEHLKLDYRILISLLVTTLLLTSCNKIIDTIDFLGIFPPCEQKLELQLKKQALGETFSFAEYCKEEYDNIFLIYPYFNTEKEDFVNLKMSDRLRRVCNVNTDFDTFATLLFVNEGEVKAFSEISFEYIRLMPPQIPENKYIFPFEQKFILDNNRYIHIYEE